MPNPPKALVFDLDGVLIESEPLHLATWLQCLAELEIKLRPGEERMLQGRTADQVAAWLAESGRGEIDRERLVERKRALYEERFRGELTAVPGVDGFLRGRKGRLPLALVTSSGLKMVGQVMLLFNWRNIFDALIGREHVTRTKPHPEPYQQAATRLKLAPRDCLVFEDSAIGIEAARGAGAMVCGVATTLTAKQLRSAGAQWTIASFEDAAGLDMAMAGLRPGRLTGWLRGLVD